MLPEILLSISAAVLIGIILVCEWMAVPESKARVPEGKRAALQHTDVFLAACFGFCLIVIWLPFFLR